MFESLLAGGRFPRVDRPEIRVVVPPSDDQVTYKSRTSIICTTPGRQTVVVDFSVPK